jgi:hypothetical protein
VASLIALCLIQKILSLFDEPWSLETPNRFKRINSVGPLIASLRPEKTARLILEVR